MDEPLTGSGIYTSPDGQIYLIEVRDLQENAMDESTGYGTVTNYATGEAIRPATREEWRRTMDKLASEDSDAYTGAWLDDDGRAVYVDGGPDE